MGWASRSISVNVGELSTKAPKRDSAVASAAGSPTTSKLCAPMASSWYAPAKRPGLRAAAHRNMRSARPSECVEAQQPTQGSDDVVLVGVGERGMQWQ